MEPTLDQFKARMTIRDDDSLSPIITYGYVDPFLRQFYFNEDGVPGFCEIEDGDLIEQCTGLRDSKENLIFEGDVVEHTRDGVRGEIIFSADEWKFVIMWDSINISLTPMSAKYLTVIGS